MFCTEHLVELHLQSIETICLKYIPSVCGMAFLCLAAV